MKTMHTKASVLSKKRRIRSAVISVCAVLAVLCLVLFVRKTAASQAKRCIVQKYGDLIPADELTVAKVGHVQIADRAWPVFLTYDGIDFQIDLLNKRDDFAEKYTEAEYIRRILAEYPGDDLRMLEIPFVQTDQGMTDRLPLDRLFFLEASFDHAVNSREAFADRTEELLRALRRAGLHNCDTLEAFASIEGRSMHIRISPGDGLTQEDILDQIAVFPSTDE